MEAMKIIWVRGDEGKRADGKDVQNITLVGRAHSLGVVVRERTGMAVWPEERHGEERRNGFHSAGAHHRMRTWLEVRLESAGRWILEGFTGSTKTCDVHSVCSQVPGKVWRRR